MTPNYRKSLTPKIRRRVASGLFAMASLAGISANAATLYWDPNGATPDATTSAAGSWNGTNLYWNSDSTGGAGGAVSAVTTTSDDLIFSTAGYTAGGTVTIFGTPGARSLTFGLGGISLTGGNLTLGTGGITADAGSGPNTISTVLAFSNNTITNNSGNLLTFSGANTNSGTLSILGSGTVAATNNNSFGSGSVSIGSESTVLVGAGLTSRFLGTGALSIGSGGSTLTNAGALNSFAGTLNVNTTGGSKLQLATSGQTIGSGVTVNVANGATMYLTNATSAVNGVTFNLNGLGNTEYAGALRTDSVIGASSTINLLSDSSIGGSGTMSAPISGAFALAKMGNSTLSYTGTSSHSGATSVNQGTLLLAGAGNLANTSGVTVTGATLISGTSTDAVTANRINSAAGLTLGGVNGAGAFTLTKPTAGTSTQTFANLSLGPGLNAINNTAGASALVFTGVGGAGYSRSAGGFINFGTNTVSFTNAPADATGASVTNGGSSDILIGATVNNTDFVSAAAGAPAAPTYTANTFGAGINTNITSGTTLSGDTQSIRFSAGNPTLTISGTTTIASGGILSGGAGTQVTTGGAIRAPSGENLWIVGASGNNLTINSAIIDNNGSGLEKFGANTLNLGGNNSFTGEIYGSGGTIQLNNVNALGSGTANFNAVGSITVRSGVNGIIHNRNFLISPGQGLTFDTNGQASTTVNGSLVVSGTGNSVSLTKSGGGTLYFTGATVNTPNLGFNINGGTLDLTGTIASTSGGWNLAGATGAGAVINVHDSGIFSLTGDLNYLTAAGASAANPNVLTLNIADNSYLAAARAFIAKSNNTTAVINQTGGVFAPSQLYLNAQGASGTNVNATYNLDGGTLRLNQNAASMDTNAVLNLNGGTLQFTGNGTMNSSNTQIAQVGGVAGRLVAKANGGTLEALNGVAYTIAAPITHDAALGATVDGGITKSGVGKVTLTGTNTYTGATALNAGTLVPGIADVGGSGGALGNGGAITFGGGTLQYVSASAGTDFSSRFKNSTGAILLDNNGLNLTLAGTIDSSNVGGLTINDSATTKGTVSLSGANTFTGNTTVSSGTLKLLNSLALQNSVLASGGTGLVFDSSVASHAFTVGGLSGGTALALKDSANNPIALTVGNNNTSASYTGILSGSGSLVKVGTGTQSLNINSTYTGKTAINGGVLSIGNGDSALGTGPGSAVADQLTLSSGTLRFTGSTTLTANRGITLGAAGGAFDSQEFAPVINGNMTGSGGLTKVGSGILSITGSNNFTGGVSIKEGTLQVRNFALGTSTTDVGTVTLGDAANTGASASLVFTLGNLNSVIKTPINVVGTGSRSLGVVSYSPNFSGAVTLNDTDLTIYSNNTGGSTMTVSGGITGTGNLVLQSNAANSKVNLVGAMINPAGSILVNGTGVGVSGNSDATISAVIGSNVTGVTHNAPGYSLILSGSNSSFAGGVTVKAGNVWLSSSIYAAGTSAITLGDTEGSADTTLTINTGSGVTNPINVVGGNTGTATIRINSTNTLLSSPIVLQGHDVVLSKVVTGQGQMSGGITGTGNVVINNLDGSKQLQLVTGQINHVGTLTNSSVASVGSNGGSTITAVIGTNVTGLIQNTESYLALNAANTFKGDTTLSSGTLVINHSNALQNSVLNLNDAGGFATFGGLTGSAKFGGLQGNGNLDLVNISGTAVNLTIGNSNAANGSLANPNTLNPVYSGVIGQTTGTAGLTKVGSNTQTLAGLNTYTGPTNVNGGTLIVTGGISGSVNVNENATLGGNGTIGALTATLGGIVAPGAVTAGSILNVNGDVQLGSDGLAQLSMKIGGTSAGVNHDQVNILNGSTLNLTNVELQGTLFDGYTPENVASTSNGLLNLDGDVYYLVIGAGAVNGAFANQISAAQSAQFGYNNFASIQLGGQWFAISYDATAGVSFSNGGNDIALMAVVPEPGSWVMVLGGFGMLIGTQRMRRRINR